jgi:hypothetical protein
MAPSLSCQDIQVHKVWTALQSSPRICHSFRGCIPGIALREFAQRCQRSCQMSDIQVSDVVRLLQVLLLADRMSWPAYCSGHPLFPPSERLFLGRSLQHLQKLPPTNGQPLGSQTFLVHHAPCLL